MPQTREEREAIKKSAKEAADIAAAAFLPNTSGRRIASNQRESRESGDGDSSSSNSDSDLSIGDQNKIHDREGYAKEKINYPAAPETAGYKLEMNVTNTLSIPSALSRANSTAQSTALKLPIKPVAKNVPKAKPQIKKAKKTAAKRKAKLAK